MAVCNLFKELTNNTGNFLLFSQYSEDLTENFLKPSEYHITPSKFIALKCNYNNYDNKTLPTLFQNKFENSCAYFRDFVDENDKDYIWTPEVSKNIFWGVMASNGFLNISSDLRCEEVMYIGDINMQSYDVYNGMGYSEIYCYIPNEAKRTDCIVKENGSGRTITYPNDYIMGFQESDLRSGMLRIKLNDTEKSLSKGLLYDFSDVRDSNEKLFEFNTIVVLYDILNSNGETLYSDIPMGIYFTGILENEVMTNTVTKYVSNEDIYNAGTSYGLRICSRFSSQTQESKIVSVNSDGSAAELSIALSEMSETITKMNEVISNVHASNVILKESLAAFKNSRTNVPYIKKIGDTDYWFINGRQIGSTSGYNPYADNDIDKAIDDYDNILLNE